MSTVPPAATVAAAITSVGRGSIAHSTQSAVLLQSVEDFFAFKHIGNVNDAYIRNFTFEQGVTPLSSIVGVAVCVLLYVAIVRLLERFVQARGKPFDLNWYVIFHNSLMSIMSAVLWFSMVCELFMLWSKYGLWSLGCDPSGDHIRGPIYFIYFVNYVFKYVELIDTFLLALRGKPIPFLHIYHHAATLVLCWSQMWAQSCIQWLPIVINLMVHVIMYAYYALHALGKDIWWKKYLTMLQIVQFVAALIGCFLALGARILSHGIGWLDERVYGCYGTYGGAYVGVAIIASYLYLFVVMYRATYSKKKRAAGLKNGAVVPLTNGAVNGASKREFSLNGNGHHAQTNGDHQD